MADPFLSMKITGLEQVKAELAKLAPEVRAKVARKALKESSKALEDEVRNNAPVDSGRLKQSVRTRVSVTPGRESARVLVGGDLAWYAHLVEYGFTHTSHGKKANRKPTSRGAVEGKAFMRKAAERLFEPTVAAFEAAVKEAVERVIRKQAAEALKNLQ